jgi:hypothetical protein
VHFNLICVAHRDDARWEFKPAPWTNDASDALEFFKERDPLIANLEPKNIFIKSASVA